MIKDDFGINRMPYCNENLGISSQTRGLTSCCFTARYKVRWEFLG